MRLTNRAYDMLKFVALVLLPAISALYVTLAQVWHFPSPEAVVGTLTAIDTLLGLLLKTSSTQHAAEIETPTSGELLVGEDEEGKFFRLDVPQSTMENITSLDKVTFDVRPVSSTPTSE